MFIHKPVLLKEAVESLNLKPGDTVVDATLGGGGHSREILKIIIPGGKLVAIDRDESVISRFKKSLGSVGSVVEPKAENLLLVHSNYSSLEKILADNKISSVQAIIADLGISSIQIDDEKRGFSFLHDGPLDMRMDKQDKLTAADIVNNYAEDRLEKIIRENAEERFSRKIAASIVREREQKKITTTGELVDAIRLAVPKKYQYSKIHFATRTFQALRLEVNHELFHLEDFITQAISSLAPNGRLAVISFHSGEDRIVKQSFRKNARGCICPKEIPVCRCQNRPRVKIMTKKPIYPTDKEIMENPRSRSAKMRVVEKI
jgi:16S rRNA (cytosine1402-N4)-methyltransferase